MTPFDPTQPPDPAFANQTICCWSTTMFSTAAPEIQEAAVAAAQALSKFEEERSKVVEYVQQMAQQTAAGMEVAWAASDEGQRKAEAFIEESAGGRNGFLDIYSNVLADFIISQARDQLS